MSLYPKRSYDSIKFELEQLGYELLTQEAEYTATYKPISIRCPKCASPFTSILCNLRKVSSCKNCARNRKKTYEEMQTLFATNGCMLLTQKSDYKDTHTKVEYICKCGQKDTKIPEAFRSGQRCWQCGVDKRSGQNSPHYGTDRKGDKNPNWNPALTDEERMMQRRRSTSNEYRRWRRACHKRDNWTCQKCHKRGGELNVHHIENFSSNKDRRYDITNGITLCKKHHDLFHQMNGKQNNNREQLNCFLLC